MTTITVLAQILAGNMGEVGHPEALTDFIRETWAADLADLAEAGHDVEINIEIQRNASGCSRAVEVWCDDPDLLHRAESALTDESRIWELFCRSVETL